MSIPGPVQSVSIAVALTHHMSFLCQVLPRECLLSDDCVLFVWADPSRSRLPLGDLTNLQQEHIDNNADLVLIEMSVNDFRMCVL